MGAAFFLLIWSYGISAIAPTIYTPSPKREPKLEDAFDHRIMRENSLLEWSCPEIENIANISCACDVAHTVRCRGYASSSFLLFNLTKELTSASGVSLLDLSIHNVKELPPRSFESLELLGLIISSAGIQNMSMDSFDGLEDSLGALALPSNSILVVPSSALRKLKHLHSLDISDNLINVLNPGEFETLSQLQELNLGGNNLQIVEPKAFVGLKKLRNLNLSRNKLNSSQLLKSGLRELHFLEELSLQSNLLEGPLSSSFLPPISSLRTLDLSHNSLKSVVFGALEGCQNLLRLDLSYNLVEVIEDHAFRNLSSLQRLYLAHNNIVAVSGWSFGHLVNLLVLSMADNALFGVTADLIHQLPNLKSLDVSANDISLLQPHVFNFTPSLTEFDFGDNPLNCDCWMSWFWDWLHEHPLIKKDSQMTVVCATPPDLENAPLVQLNRSDLTCLEKNSDYYHDGVGDYEEVYELRLSNMEVSLQGAQWVNDDVQLIWSVDERALPYSCQAVHIYEMETFQGNTHQILAEKIEVNCSSEEQPNPYKITVTIPASELRPGNTYRYCLVLLELGSGDDEGFLPGCSEAILLTEPPIEKIVQNNQQKITSLTAGTMGQILIAQTRVNLVQMPCSYTLYLILEKTVADSHQLNCSETRHSFSSLMTGDYIVCAILDEDVSFRGSKTLQHGSLTSMNSSTVIFSTFSSCTNVLLTRDSTSSWTSGPILVLLFTLPGLALIITLYVIGRRVWKGGGVPWKWDPRARKRAKYFLYTGETISPTVSLDPLPSIVSLESTTRV